VNTHAAAARERPISVWRWGAWWAAIGGGILVFYVLLTPVWLGLRAAAWLADFRARRRPGYRPPVA
jgi:hypothetical protein